MSLSRKQFFKFALQFLALGEIKLVLAYKQIVLYSLHRVFHQQLVLVGTEYDSDRRIVILGADLFFEEIQVHVHLPHIVMLDFAAF